MHRFFPALLATSLVAACGSGQGKAVAVTEQAPDALPVAAVQLKAADGAVVFGRYYRTAHPRALILLFHQAGSSKDEYASIAPQLNRAGYAALAIDQRAGGGLYGPNETAAALGHKADYLEAKPDLQAAVDWGKQQKLPLILWGSSYSASLVFLVAAENAAAVKAVLAFSPGEYFDDKTRVARAAATLSMPVFVTSASDPEEVAAARAILAVVPGPTRTQYVPAAGVHGSSTLIGSKNPKGVDANWQVVLAFLRKVTA